jgi:hypothetical protein
MIILNIGTFDDPTVARRDAKFFRHGALPWTEVHALRKTGRLKIDSAGAVSLESELHQRVQSSGKEYGSADDLDVLGHDLR